MTRPRDTLTQWPSLHTSTHPLVFSKFYTGFEQIYDNNVNITVSCFEKFSVVKQNMKQSMKRHVSDLLKNAQN